MNTAGIIQTNKFKVHLLYYILFTQQIGRHFPALFLIRLDASLFRRENQSRDISVANQVASVP